MAPIDLWTSFVRAPTEASFLPLYEATKRLVWTLAVRILRDPAEASDAFQGAYCRLLLLSRDRSAADAVDDLSALVARIAVREADRLKKRRGRRAAREVLVAEDRDMHDASRQHGDRAPKHASSPLEEASRRELCDKLERIVDGLPDAYRVPIVLHYFDGLSLRQIAAALALPLGTVAHRHRRALEKLDRPLRRAGLRDAATAFASAAAVACLLEPGLAAGAVFASAQAGMSAALTAGSSAAFAPTPSALGTGIIMNTKLKVAVAAALVLLAMAGGWALWPSADDDALEHLAGAPADSSSFAADDGSSTTVGDPAVAPLDPPSRDENSTSAAETAPPRTPVDAPANPPVEDFVTGIVTDATTGAPLAGAIVRVQDSRREGPQATTDARGEYAISHPGDGSLHVVASCADHANASAYVEHSSPAVSIQDFALAPGATVIVHVTDDHGAPLSGVRVTPSTHGVGYYVDVGIDTDEHGVARLERLSRTTPPNIMAAKEGYEKAFGRPRFDPDRAVAELRLALLPSDSTRRAIAGRVTAPDGHPLAGARIEWKDGAGTRFAADESYGEIHAITDHRGEYWLEFVDDYETCYLGVAAPGWGPRVQHGVRPGTPEKPAEVNFVLEPGHWLAGRVVDEAGEALENALVHAMPKRHLLRKSVAFPAVLREARTDRDGRFRLEDLSGPKVAISVSKRGQPSVEKEVEVDREIEIVLQSHGAIRGVVVDADSGEAIEAFTVRTRSGPAGVSVREAEIGTSFTSPEGRFALEGLRQDGAYKIQILADGYPPADFVDVRPGPADAADDRAFALSRGRALEGTVVDAETGAPLAGVRVQATANELADSIVPRVWDPMRLILDLRSVITDEDGRFRFLETDALRLLADTSGRCKVFVSPKERDRYDDGTGHLVIPLHRGETLEGVVYKNGRPASAVNVGIDLLVSTDSGVQPEQRALVASDGEGRFRETGLEPGEYRVVVTHHPGHPNASFRFETRRYVRLESGQATSIELGRAPGPITLRGAVAGMEDRESLWVEVRLRRHDQPEAPEYFFKTYGQWEWRYAVHGLDPGTYRVTVAYFASDGTRSAALEPLEIEAGETPEIRVPREP